VVDAGLALALTAWALTQLGANAGRALALLVMTVAIAWRRRAPLAILAVEAAGVGVLRNNLGLPQGVALLIAAFSAALYSDQRVIVAALLLAVSAWLLAFGGGVQVPNGLVPFLILAPVWGAGSALRRREQWAEASAQRADRLEQDQEAALRAERARIARELHDVVTHSVSVMVMQTGAARQIMGRDVDRSGELLQSVEASGRSALEELRRLLGLLSEEDENAPLEPQPGVTEIGSLVDQVRDTGIPVELSIEGQPRVVSRGVAVAVYRIVQEALTNVLKHAGGAPTSVVLRWASGELEVEILDRGPPQWLDDTGAWTGRGLAGMRERATMYGGTLDAGPGPEGGYAVRARIPLERGGA
jgi:signal transduction histidine kinase